MIDSKYIIGFVVLFLLGVLAGIILNPLGIFLSEDDYYIKIGNADYRDIRDAPHWDLIEAAWTDSQNQLLLKINRNTHREYYNWIHSKYVEKTEREMR